MYYVQFILHWAAIGFLLWLLYKLVLAFIDWLKRR